MSYFHQQRARAQLATRRLIQALPHDALRRTMASCGEPTEWQHSGSCRKVGCARCRYRYIDRQTDRATKRFEAGQNGNFGFLTIVFGTTGVTEEIGPTFTDGRRALRNLIDRLRRSNDRFKGLEVLGFMEVDALGAADGDKLPPQRRELFEALNECWLTRKGMPIWVVTLHAIVKLGDVTQAEFDAALRTVWTKPYQVHLAGFHAHKSLDQNIRGLLLYALKNEACSTFWFDDGENGRGLIDEPWPDSWRAAYYSYIDQWSRGFQSLRVSIEAYGRKNTRHGSGNDLSPQTPTEDANPEFDEPLPILLHEEAWSTFSPLYRLTSSSPPGDGRSPEAWAFRAGAPRGPDPPCR